MGWSNGECREDYDDDKVLDAYISSNLYALLSDHDGKAYLYAKKLAGSRNNAEHTSFLQKLLAGEPREVIDAVKLGSSKIYDQVKNRILSGQIRVNRCLECNRIVRTPNAKQCLWCGHDWHHDQSS